MNHSARRERGFTLIEVLIGVALIGILAGVAVSAYASFIQRARETAVIQYLREAHKAEQVWRLQTDSPGYTGDFDDLDDTGYMSVVESGAAVTRRNRRTGRVRETSSRIYQTYQLTLTAVSTPSTEIYTYTLTARPQDGRTTVRWFFIDQSGILRAGTGAVSARSQPI